MFCLGRQRRAQCQLDYTWVFSDLNISSDGQGAIVQCWVQNSPLTVLRTLYLRGSGHVVDVMASLCSRNAGVCVCVGGSRKVYLKWEDPLKCGQ